MVMIIYKKGHLRKNSIHYVFDEGYFKMVSKEYAYPQFIQNDKLYGKERWLVEWVSIDEIPKSKLDYLTKEVEITQKTLQGRRSHRTFVYCKGKWKPHGTDTTANMKELDDWNEKLKDNFGKMF